MELRLIACLDATPVDYSMLWGLQLLFILYHFLIKYWKGFKMPQELFEEILRNAFSYQSSRYIDRAGDPARLADTDEYSEININRVKIGLG